MEQELEAFKIAIEYADKQYHWYQNYGNVKLYLFRISGVIAILSTILITYLSATLDSTNPIILGFRKSILIAILAAFSAVSVSLSSFFGWKSSWESHRVAQFQIEALIVDAKIQQQKILTSGVEEDLFALAQSLTTKVRDITSEETVRYYSGQKNIRDVSVLKNGSDE